MVAWLSTIANAAPTFVGADEDLAIATEAWAAARSCTGREGLATEQVEIVRRALSGDYLGVARTHPDGRLYRVEINAPAERHRGVLVHEITHAWVSDGPIALVEGVAELLADCIVDRSPGLAPPTFDDGRELAAMPDLLTWDKPSDHAPHDLHASRTDAYVGAARMVRSIARSVPEDRLWASRTVSWEGLRAVSQGTQVAEWTSVLSAGEQAQRLALADDDRDGLTALDEALLGTDPTRFDSDGDGWWDGAEAPPGALPVPLDGTPVCAGGVAAEDGPVGVVTGGNRRGPLGSRVVTRTSGEGRPVLVELQSTDTSSYVGATWALVPGLRAGDGCVSNATVTAWSEHADSAPHVEEFSRLLEHYLTEAAHRFGPGPGRVAVVLGGAHTRVEGEVVRWATADLGHLTTADLTRLAATSVAVRRLWVDGETDWAAAEAVGRSLAP